MFKSFISKGAELGGKIRKLFITTFEINIICLYWLIYSTILELFLFLPTLIYIALLFLTSIYHSFMVKVDEKGKIQRRSFYGDWEFFSIWKVSDKRFYREGDFIRIADVEEASENEINFLKRIYRFFSVAWVRTDIIKKFNDVSISTSNIANAMANEHETNENIIKSFNRFKKKTYGLIDIINLDDYIEYLEHKFYLDLDFNKEERAKIENYLDTYIDEYINHELLVVTTSYFIFEKQKEWFIKKIQEMKAIENFGVNFIMSKKSRWDQEVLFFHTLYALEKLGYVDVISIYYTSSILDKTDKTYCANIIVNETFIKEINQEFQKTNPKKYIEKFDSNTGILTFWGKKIELSKNGKETDPVLLMKTLMKKEEWEWVHNDEIFEDWGIREDEQVSKNKIYFALQKINTTMGLVAQIDDFIEWWTKKARINPKYRKVDK